MWQEWLQFAIAIAIAVVGAVALALIVTGAMRLFVRKRQWPASLITRARRPFRAFVLVIGLWVAIAVTFPDPSWLPALNQAMTILTIVVGAWLVGAMVLFLSDLALGRYRIDVPDNRVARRIRTQTLILRRLAIAIIVVLAGGAILLTFPEVRAVGASVLASAGIASVIAGLAAQSVLANMFAGIQLVFSEALRVDDVVVVEGEWGRVGEITLSYVVLDLWDERRLVLPCTYFTTTPFENWTRDGSAILGAVELDVDWRVSPSKMRDQLTRILADTDLWDGRTAVLQVTDAVAGYVRVRVLVSAVDAPTLFDLRCSVRESMVTWMQRTMPAALPTQRVLLTEASGEIAEPEEPRPDTGGLFTGSAEAVERASAFTQAIPVVGGAGGGEGEETRSS
ncbi:mechanosensitive ion channel family protein [Microbacterium invictum]|uniref:Mechanosensitive ion channel family protein n=1 Tax=Microbacterium invictum TaxID=515415 RepID=A0ABZ0VCD6_9MICO|nr:mechanosensitive ion channel family protein [Microbacterium invictum]WQB71293.1 mechanosensitive ion channel family protein [Microbacterium invictum]